MYLKGGLKISSVKNYLYKICVLGDAGVGKTSLVIQYCENRFEENYIMTLGSNFYSNHVELEKFPSVNVPIQIWDLAGQSQFDFIRENFYIGAKGVIYVYDLTRESSFSHLMRWKAEVGAKIELPPSILIGNKLDIAIGNAREVTKEEAESFLSQLGALSYHETSAKEDCNVDNIFEIISEDVLKAEGRI